LFGRNLVPTVRPNDPGRQCTHGDTPRTSTAFRRLQQVYGYPSIGALPVQHVLQFWPILQQNPKM
jgi:hypothetical protein